jgi:hypothetical protein
MRSHFADPNGPVSVPGAFTLALGAVAAVPAITQAFRTGALPAPSVTPNVPGGA